MAAWSLYNRRACTLGHLALQRRRNHPVIGRDQVPAWLASPGGLADRAARGLEAPRDLGVGHELREVLVHIGRERLGELAPVEQQKTVLRRQYRRGGLGRGRGGGGVLPRPAG